MSKLSFVFLLFILLTNSVAAQKFEAGVIAGINLSALNEDNLGDHFGINTGLKGRYNLNKKWAASLEILYSRNGEYALPDFYPNIVYDKVHLDFLEIPVQAEWKIYAQKEQSPFITMGVAATYLIDFYAEDTNGEEVTEFVDWNEEGLFNDVSLQGQLGLLLPLNKHIRCNIKLSTPLTTSELTPTLTLRGIWML